MSLSNPFIYAYGRSFIIRFFANKGAVAGVFLIIGLAAASIVLWIVFALRRRHRVRQLERDTTVSATLAAAGLNRAPLDDDDDEETEADHRARTLGSGDIEMGQRPSSTLGYGTGGTRPPSAYRDLAYDPAGSPDEDPSFDPYAGYVHPQLNGSRSFSANKTAAQEGYVPARTGSPTPPNSPPRATSSFGHGNDTSGSGSATGISSGDRERRTNSSLDHMRSYSMGSYEPLLGGSSGAATPGVGASPTPPPRNPLRLANSPSPGLDGQESNTPPNQSSDTGGRADDRLDPYLGSRLRTAQSSSDVGDLRDDEDYSRPVLGVSHILVSGSTLLMAFGTRQIRNVPDTTSVSDYSHDG